jgi:hypothetical protein
MKKTLISTIFVLLSGFINSYSQTISNDTIINDSVIIDLNNKLQECRLSINELENDKQLLIQEKDSIDNLFQNITNQNDSILNTNIKLININNEIINLNDSLYAKNLNLQENLKSVIERYYNDSILWEEKREKIEKENFTIRQINDTLAQLNKDYRLQLTEKNNLLEEKIKILQQKEILFAEKEQLYKDAINSTTLDKAKVEGLVDAKNAQIEGKEKEINLLQKNINEKEASIEAKNQDLYKVIEEKQRYYLMSDTLRTKLVEAEKEILRREEELKYTRKRAEEAEAKIATATNRRKKVRVIQGIAMRYPSPNWDISPRANASGGYDNVIYNKNSSIVEFDFITGASVMLYDLTKEGSKFNQDISLYVGFGGANLFKNFYLGPSYRFLDFFHITAGVNVAEYTMLAEDFNKEGDALLPGWSIRTTNQWKVTPFLSLSLDLDFLSYMGKK